MKPLVKAMMRLVDSVRALAMVAAFALAACSTQVASEPASAESLPTGSVHPVSGLEIILLKVESGTRTHAFQVELADTPAEQQRGLMFRTELGPDEGMLFPSHPPGPRSFWMKNTPLSLDIIFIGLDSRIVNIAANTTPYSLESIPSRGNAIAVLELRGGRAAELGIAPGDKVSWPKGE
ncbi:DUF192 domain-containing protein [Altererythrobacter sp.]|uniref:DUF192 domain-containing protein n=1 Tax=Altererythrobacter sp. TaxID=1872480 RepID=UPI003D02BED3